MNKVYQYRYCRNHEVHRYLSVSSLSNYYLKLLHTTKITEFPYQAPTRTLTMTVLSLRPSQTALFR